jgi:hypothetical protein
MKGYIFEVEILESAAKIKMIIGDANLCHLEEDQE